MKLIHNKKGQSDGDGMFVGASKVYYYLFILTIVVLAFVLFILFSKGWISSLAKQPPSLESDLTTARITNICFSPTNPLDKTPESNVILLSNFTEEQLNQCFMDWQRQRIQLDLESVDGSFKNKRVFTEQGGLKTKNIRYVLVQTPDGKRHPAWLTVRMP